jgi:type II secretion system protein I
MDFKHRQGQRRRQASRSGGGSREGGFTLLEVIVALSMMLIAGLGVASAFIYSMNNNNGAAERALAMSVAQQRHERIRSLKFEEIVDEVATVESAGRTYNVETIVTVDDTDADDGKDTLKTISIEVTPANTHETWATEPVVLWTQRAALSLGDNR